MVTENLDLSAVTTLQYNIGILSLGIGRAYGSGTQYF